MEFEIVGFRKGNDGKDLTVRKKNIYTRILIRKKQVMNKYCPEQFEIVGLDRYTVPKNDLIGGRLASSGKIKYARILIMNKHPEESECRERNIKEHVLKKSV